ncbi:MAG: transglutaminase family protein [Actinomycetota bacterium]|nr:transglutaminase family protein [Actinomycetota bacterium]
MTRFTLHQRLRYDYTSPIRRLEHRLMVLPPAVHVDQTRVSYRLAVHGAGVETVESEDAFGNLVVAVRARRVARHVEFEIGVVVDRESTTPVPFARPAGPVDRRLLAPSSLTAPDAALRAVARELLGSGQTGIALAELVNARVHAAMRYRHDVTTVRTTAAEALALGEGVCQDYAHVMLALCRLCRVPARYVSGHLQGEGGSHAWVEVLVPGCAPVAFDPTNGRQAGATYLTIAVGRDYADIAPTYGTYSGAGTGTLTTAKVLVVEAADLLAC